MTKKITPEDISEWIKEHHEVWIMSKEITPTDISKWIQKHHDVKISPRAVGHYLRRIGYTTELERVNGKVKRIVKPIRE